MSNELDYLGEFIVKNLRDVALEMAEGLCAGEYDDPGNRRYQEELKSLTDAQKKLIHETVAYCIDGGMNDFLAHLDKAVRSKKRIALLIDGQTCTDLTKGLHKELHGPQGWKARFSSYPAITAK